MALYYHFRCGMLQVDLVLSPLSDLLSTHSALATNGEFLPFEQRHYQAKRIASTLHCKRANRPILLHLRRLTSRRDSRPNINKQKNSANMQQVFELAGVFACSAAAPRADLATGRSF